MLNIYIIFYFRIYFESKYREELIPKIVKYEEE